MNLKDLVAKESPTQNEAYFCIGLGYLEGYNNPIIIGTIEKSLPPSNPLIVGTIEKSSTSVPMSYVNQNSNSGDDFSKLFSVGLCWPYDKTIPDDLKGL